jgi:branched-subunit amino acid ABC-type transport system permease component
MIVGQFATLIVFALVLLILIVKPTGLLQGTLFE